MSDKKLSLPVNPIIRDFETAKKMEKSKTVRKTSNGYEIDNLKDYCGGTEPGQYKNYDELEFGDFPTLWPRAEKQKDDIDSITKSIAVNFPGKLYSNLLTAAVLKGRKKIN